jgi:hypothetical protein
MKYIYIIILISIVFLSTPVLAKTTPVVKQKTPPVWKAMVPEGYTQITWAKAPGIATFFKAPSNNGSMDFLTRIYLPQNQIGFISSSSTPLNWGVADQNFAPDTTTQTYHNFAFSRIVAETSKKTSATAKFIWNAPFFNIFNPTSDLSMALKSTVGTTTMISSGSRPPNDMAQDRRMLIINNKTGSAFINNFESAAFVSSSIGDQALEGFAPTVAINDNASGATGRLFLGVTNNNKELLIYCSQHASIQEASDALLLAGVPIENQLEADGGGSAACGYNLPGQFFVEPTRTLPLLMGAMTIISRGIAITKDLNVRSGPATKFPIVIKLPKGAPVLAFEEKNGWLRIGEGQWVLKSLIKKT